MSIEVEQKYRISDPQTLLTRLSELGAVEQPAVTQKDTYFAHPAREFATTDEALRIRRVGDANLVTYKGPKLDAISKTRREIEVSLASGEVISTEFQELLEALGFCPVAEVSKIRRSFNIVEQGQNTVLALDDVDQVGHYIELEIVVEQESMIPDARHRIDHLANVLQLAQPERKSYLELLLGQEDRN